MPPSDEEMIRHFATHEATFRKVYEIMAESSEGSFHYPSLSPDGVIILDSTEQSDTSHETNDEQDIPVYGLLKPDRLPLLSIIVSHSTQLHMLAAVIIHLLVLNIILSIVLNLVYFLNHNLN